MSLFDWLLGRVGYAGFLVFRILELLCYCLWVASGVWLYADLDALFVGCFFGVADLFGFMRVLLLLGLVIGGLGWFVLLLLVSGVCVWGYGVWQLSLPVSRVFC